jgi:hypothetical protein
MMKRRDLPLREHCHVDFRSMRERTETSRSCAECETPVHDLSAMAEAEARALLAGRDDVCVRYLHDREGHVVFTDAPPRILPPGWLVRTRRAALVAAATLSPLLLEACGPQCPNPTDPECDRVATPVPRAPSASVSAAAAPGAAGSAPAAKKESH